MLATGSLVSSATAVRVSVGCLGLLVQRTPPLVRNAVRASVGTGNGRAQAEFRDDLIALARDSAEVSWRELRRGVDALDAYTRPAEEPAVARHSRPYRVKS
jgi:hypothetical protein